MRLCLQLCLCYHRLLISLCSRERRNITHVMKYSSTSSLQKHFTNKVGDISKSCSYYNEFLSYFARRTCTHAAQVAQRNMLICAFCFSPHDGISCKPSAWWTKNYDTACCFQDPQSSHEPCVFMVHLMHSGEVLSTQI